MESFLRDGGHVTASLLKDGGAGYNPGIGRNSAGRTLYAHSGLKNDQTQWEFDTGTLDVTADREYDAFGRTVASAGTWEGPLGYAGGFGYQSSSSNYDFQLLGHRYYDPETGRFLTRDPIKDGRNWYVYCNSNPIRFADPTGLLVPVVVLMAKIAIKAYAGRVVATRLATQVVTGTMRGVAVRGATNSLVREAVKAKKVHGNRRDDREVWLYALVYNDTGYLQKWGITGKANALHRYTKKMYIENDMIPLKRGKGIELVQEERELVEEHPGPMNREPWAGARKDPFQHSPYTVEVNGQRITVNPALHRR